MKRTVFILGAGASAVFDFPVGKALCQQVCNNLHSSSKSDLMKEFRECGSFANEDIDNFCTQLRNSGQFSVDAFLEHRTEFLNLGKAAIAFMLVRHEISDKVISLDGDNWLSYMFNYGIDVHALANMHEIPISFVTFNYDRSLEHYLHTIIQNRYRKTSAESASIMERIPIIHLHGRLGYLPWQNDIDSRPFEPLVNHEVLNTCIKSIKVVHEDSSKDGRDADFREAQRLLGLAEYVYFLGFGYGPTNMERLGVRSLAPKIIRGTGFGLTGNECSAVKVKSDDRVTPTGGATCIGLLRDYVDWS